VIGGYRPPNRYVSGRAVSLARLTSLTGRYADTQRRLTPVRRRFTSTVREQHNDATETAGLFVIFHFDIFNNKIIPLACLSDPSPPPNHPSIIICRPRPLRSGQSRSLISTPNVVVSVVCSRQCCVRSFRIFFILCSGHSRLTFTTLRDRIDSRWYVHS